MLETNVHGVLRMTRLCLPHIRDGGHIVNMGSIAGRQPYENARRLHHLEVRRARLHVRAARGPARPPDPHHDRRRPGSSRSNFSRVRFRGDEEKASAVYADVEPLTPETSPSAWSSRVTRPPHVNIDELVVKALAQSTPVRINRDA